MTTVKRRRAPRPAALDMARIVREFNEFRRLKRAEAEAKTAHERIRDSLMPLLERHGQPHGEHGAHRAIELPEPIDGYTKLVRRRNATPLFDLDAAEALAKERGVLPQVQSVSLNMTGIDATRLEELEKAIAAGGLERLAPVNITVYVDQDKVYALHAREPDVITEADLDALLTEDVRYSFHPEK